MLFASEGIVIHQIQHSDQHNILRIYTRMFGMISLLVPAGKSKVSSKALFQPMTPVEVQFQRKNSNSFSRMKDIRLLYSFQNIPSSAYKIAQMLFLAEIVLKAIREEERNDSLFDFMLNSILLLEEYDYEVPDFHLKFILDLTRFLGFYPSANFSEDAQWFSVSEGAFLKHEADLCLDKRTSEALYLLMRTSLLETTKLPFSGAIRRSMLRGMIQFYQWHHSSVKDLKTPQVLEEVFGV
jgi:DNA repair protein RecO (recombination protein O)